MRLHLGLPLLALATACGSGSVSLGDGPSRTCPGFGISAQELVFADSSLSTPNELTLTVSNDCLAEEGNLDISVSVNGGAFTVTPAQSVIAAQDSVELIVAYAPADYAETEGEIVIATNIEELPSVSVSLVANTDPDQDGDGFPAVEAGGDDCDDADAAVNPGAEEVWYDGIDGNCDGVDDYDQDGDGYRGGGEGEDCDDLNPVVNPDAEEIEDLEDNDCDGWVDEDLLRPGDVLVTEIMNDPVAVFDTSGEWFELTNASGRTINMINWAVRDFNGDSFVIEEPVTMEPGERVVLGVEGDVDRNGFVQVDYVYSRESFDLENTTDAIGLEVAGEVVALVEYDASWSQVAGRSLQLDREFQTGPSASLRGFWCLSSAPIVGDGGDQGTPGAENRLCPNVDHDGDGLSILDGDCDDTNPEISPDAKEVWNGIDDDCDGTTDVSELPDMESGYLEGDRRGYLGYAAGLSAGDVDHDGDIELMVSTTRNGGTLDGLVYTFEGADASGWADPAYDVDEAKLTADHSYDSMGLMSRQMADNDGDGNVDLVIGGSAGFGGDPDDNANVLLYASGKISGNLDQDDATAAWTGARGTYDGNRIASHLDTNGDGVAEIFFADPNATSDVGTFSGAILMIDADGATGVATTDDSTVESFGGSRLYGRFGSAIDGGDLNGDGYDELIGCGASESVTSNGACYIIFGSSSSLEGGTMKEVADVEITGRSGAERFGSAQRVVIADFDGDTDLDLVFGNVYRDEALVFMDAGSLDGSYDTSDSDVVIRPRRSPSYFGMGLASGDFDGDGTDDVAIGAPDTLYFAGADEPGQVWLWSGSDIATASSLSEADAWASLKGGAISDGFGQTILGADLEDDGVEDLVITAPSRNTDAGRISIILLD